jgi:serine/threonine-protein kinase RsbW
MKVNLTTVCNTRAQEEIRAFLNRYFKDTGLTESEVNQLILAIDEAIANAIIHGNQSNPEKTISMDIDFSEKRIVIEIGDIGLFDDSLRKEKVSKEIKDIIKEKEKGGLGLKLIYSIMDIVTFYTKDNKSYCMMVKLFG